MALFIFITTHVSIALDFGGHEVAVVGNLAGGVHLFADVIGVVALPRLELGNLAQWRGVTHPLDQLPVGHHPHVRHLQEVIEKALECFNVGIRVEPSTNKCTYTFEMNQNMRRNCMCTVCMYCTVCLKWIKYEKKLYCTVCFYLLCVWNDSSMRRKNVSI